MKKTKPFSLKIFYAAIVCAVICAVFATVLILRPATVRVDAAVSELENTIDLTSAPAQNVSVGAAKEELFDYVYSANENGLRVNFADRHFTVLDQQAELTFRLKVPADTTVVSWGTFLVLQGVKLSKLLVRYSANGTEWTNPETVPEGLQTLVCGGTFGTDGDAKILFIQLFNSDRENGNGPLLAGALNFFHNGTVYNENTEIGEGQYREIKEGFNVNGNSTLQEANYMAGGGGKLSSDNYRSLAGNSSVNTDANNALRAQTRTLLGDYVVYRFEFSQTAKKLVLSVKAKDSFLVGTAWDLEEKDEAFRNNDNWKFVCAGDNGAQIKELSFDLTGLCLSEENVQRVLYVRVSTAADAGGGAGLLYGLSLAITETFVSDPIIAAPVITSPVPDAYVTAGEKITVNGTGAPGAAVTVTVNGQIFGAWVDESGAFSVDVGSGYASGDLSFCVRQQFDGFYGAETNFTVHAISDKKGCAGAVGSSTPLALFLCLIFASSLEIMSILKKSLIKAI